MCRALIPLLFVLTACTAVGPQPVPVYIGVAVVDTSRIGIEATPSGVRFDGAPGAATPDGATLEVIALDRSGARAETTVAPDGSFEASLDGASDADSFRIHLFADGYTSAIVDVMAVGGAAMPLVDVDCAGQLTPAELRFDMVAVGSDLVRDVRLRHDCAEDVTLTGAVLLDDAGALTVETATPLVLPSGADATVSIRYRPTIESAVNDILLLELDGHPNGAVTVSGIALPP